MTTSPNFDLAALYDDNKSINEGAITILGYSTDGWHGRIFRGCGFFDPDKPIRKFTKKELHDLLHKDPTRIKVDGINLTYENLIPRIQKSILTKGVDAMQPHIRAFVERAVTFATCLECDGTRLSKEARSSSRGPISPTPARCRSATWPNGCAGWTNRRWPRCEGKRFEASVVDHHLGDRDISEVLAMSVTKAEEFFVAGEARTPAATRY